VTDYLPPALPVAARIRAQRWSRRPTALLTGAVLTVAALSLLYPSSPGYDPWAWIIWGREIASLELSTEKGPSWKPLPVLFTTIFSLAGDAAPVLWLFVARAGGILAVVMAFRVAARLAGRMRLLAGLIAAAGLVLMAEFLPLTLRGWSEPLLAAFMLLAVERHLDGARTAAFAFLFAGALVRPEVWPFLALYAIYLWRREPGRRPIVAALLLLVPALWFGPDFVASGDPLRGQERAQRPLPGRPGLAENPSLEVLRQGAELVVAPLLVLAALAAVLAAIAFARRRTDAAVLGLALACTAWIAIVAVMAEAGFTGNPRYLVPAAAVVLVLAGVGAVRVVELVVLAVARRSPSPGAARAAAVAAAVAMITALATAAIPAAERLGDGDDFVRTQAELPGDLEQAIDEAGGRERVLACGRVFTGIFEFPVLAWTLDLPMRAISSAPEPPGTIFRSLPASSETRVDPRFERVARTNRWEIFASCSR
jgi:hypothetical protein